MWDVFLQVFDDGRLTDSHGELVDFRRCRDRPDLERRLGDRARTGVGFEPAQGRSARRVAERALRTTFRPEFLNRIDRVVMFRPFERASMRSLLDKELARRSRAAASASGRGRSRSTSRPTRSCIDKGFSPTLGARPLRRAIEQHVLAPVAAAIVEQTVPAGDQFLFVRAAGRPDRGRRSSIRTRRPPSSRRSPRARSDLRDARPQGPGRRASGGTCSSETQTRRTRPSPRSRPRRQAPSRPSESRRSGRRTAGSTCSPRPSTSIGSKPR